MEVYANRADQQMIGEKGHSSLLPYREIAPPARLEEAVECFWAMQSGRTETVIHRVVPDGCADILFMRHGTAASLQAVGAMTRFQDATLRGGQLCVGVRFRPGMWSKPLQAPGCELADAVLPLEELWGSRARRLLDQLYDTQSIEACVRLLAGSMEIDEVRSPM